MTEDARFALLSGVIDHAPVFPPESFALPSGLAEDARARESRDAFIFEPVAELEALGVLPL